MMIRNFSVHGFKSLVELELELGSVNVFIGANGSGKSNILEALGVLGSAAYGRVDDETLQRRGVRPGVPLLYRSAFPARPIRWDIKFVADSDSGAQYMVTLWNKPKKHPGPAWRFEHEKLSGLENIVSRSPRSKHNPEQGLAALETVNLMPGDIALTLMDELRNYNIYSPNTPCLRGLAPDQQAREPVGLSGGRLPDALEELTLVSRKDHVLKACLDEVRELIDWADDFSAAPSINIPITPTAARTPLVIEFTDRFMEKGKNKLTGYDASEGALYILYCAALALHPKAPSCLAVDNIDQALNPRLATRLMERLCSWIERSKEKRQWLMTAHNPAILDGLPLSNPEVRLFAVDRNNHGHTVIQMIDLAKALEMRPNPEWTLSRMWMNGLLGAVPNV